MNSYELPANWLRSQLQRRGLSQKALADALGIDAPAASRLIGGQRRLQYAEVPRLVALLSAGSLEWGFDPNVPKSKQYRGRLEAALRTARMDPEIFAALAGQPLDKIVAIIEAGGAVVDDAVAEAASNLFGVSQAYLQMTGGPRNTPDVLYSIARRWGAEMQDEEGDLDPGRGMQSFGETVAQRPVLQVADGAIPVFAPPKPTEDGEFEWNETVAEVRVMQPLAGVAGAWGMIVGEGGMPPRFAAGDVLYVNPNRPVRHGDFAIARLGSRMVMGTVSILITESRLAGPDGEPIRDLPGAPLEKVVMATFD